MSSDAVQQFPNRDELAARRRAASEIGPTVYGDGGPRQKTWAEHEAEGKLGPGPAGGTPLIEIPEATVPDNGESEEIETPRTVKGKGAKK